MKCDEFENRIHDLLDRRSSIESDDDLRAHARQCHACQAILDAYQKLWLGLDTFDPPDLDTQFAERAVRLATGTRVVRPNPFTAPRLLAAAVAASILLAVTVFFSRRDQAGPTPEPAPIAIQEVPPSVPEDPATSLEKQLQPWPETGPLASIASGRLPLDLETLLSEERLAPMTSIAGGIEPITANLSAALHAIRSTIPLGRGWSTDGRAGDSVEISRQYQGILPS